MSKKVHPLVLPSLEKSITKELENQFKPKKTLGVKKLMMKEDVSEK